jgi:hypothetical protein
LPRSFNLKSQGEGVADEGGGAVDELHAAVVGGVALDNASEVAHLVENGGEEVVATGGDAGAVGAVGCGGQGGLEFAIFPRCGVVGIA